MQLFMGSKTFWEWLSTSWIVLRCLVPLTMLLMMHQPTSSSLALAAASIHSLMHEGQAAPVVTRFFWPPETPRFMAFPMMVSAQMSRPSVFIMNSVVTLQARHIIGEDLRTVAC